MDLPTLKLPLGALIFLQNTMNPPFTSSNIPDSFRHSGILCRGFFENVFRGYHIVSRQMELCDP
jgi:hypothetical protein